MAVLVCMGILGTTAVISAPNNEPLRELQTIENNSILSSMQIGQKSLIVTEIEIVAHTYGLSASKSVDVAIKESSLNQNAKGSSGEIGIYQFKQKTWDWFNKLRNTNLDINNVSEQIDMYCWAITQGYSSHWTTY